MTQFQFKLLAGSAIVTVTAADGCVEASNDDIVLGVFQVDVIDLTRLRG